MYEGKRGGEGWKDLWRKVEDSGGGELKIEKVVGGEVGGSMDECKRMRRKDGGLWSVDGIYMEEVIGE